MRFYVISSDGRKFGPADIATLNQWIVEGRINPDSELESAETGMRQAARDVSGLVFSSQAPAPGGAGPQPATADPLRQPTQADPLQKPTQQSPYTNPPQPASPYPRVGLGQFAPGAVPPQCQGGFNFGAFFFTWIWGLNHHAYWTLWGIPISFIPCGGLIFSIYCGMKGNETAWNSGRFSTPEECLACQNTWMYWGIGVIAFTVIAFLLVIVLSFSFG